MVSLDSKWGFAQSWISIMGDVGGRGGCLCAYVPALFVS